MKNFNADNVINLTPHAITLMAGEKEIVFPPSGTVVRATETTEIVETISICGQPVEVSRKSYGSVSGLPEYKEGVILLVSAQAALHISNRPDIYMVDRPVRDEKGRIIGCNGFSKI